MKTFYLLVFLIINQIGYSQGIVIDHRHTDLSQIPDEYITKAKANLKIRYFRRSHGSQLDIGGMAALRRYSANYNTKYSYNLTGANGEMLLSVQPATSWNSLDFENATWVAITRSYLDDPANAQINVIMWAWSSSFFECSAQQYVDDMEMLIGEYGPGGIKGRAVPVTFVFQTACGQRQLERNDNVFAGNQLIRAHCKDHNRILFDFNDLECYNPDGIYFGDGEGIGNATYTTDRLLADDLSYLSSTPGGSKRIGCRNWGIDWNNANPNSELAKLSADNICTKCEHSSGETDSEDNSRLHCVLKGRAAWFLWAVLAGWNNPNPTGIQGNEQTESQNLKNYPNPFSNNTFIEYTLNENAKVRLQIWNNSGQLIKVIVNQAQTKGAYRISVSLEQGDGLYYYTLEVNGIKTTKKMLKF